MPKLTGAEATFCSAQGGALAGVELRAVIQQHFNAKLHWKQEASHGILYFYYFLEAVLVSVQLKKKKRFVFFQGAYGIVTLTMSLVKEVW